MTLKLFLCKSNGQPPCTVLSVRPNYIANAIILLYRLALDWNAPILRLSIYSNHIPSWKCYTFNSHWELVGLVLFLGRNRSVSYFIFGDQFLSSNSVHIISLVIIMPRTVVRKSSFYAAISTRNRPCEILKSRHRSSCAYY